MLREHLRITRRWLNWSRQAPGKCYRSPAWRLSAAARDRHYGWVDRKRVRYIFDVDGLTEVELLAACRTALNLIAEEAATFECDIPWSRASDWPADVLEAAEHLQHVSRKPHKDPDYGQTGVLRAEDEVTWLAFVTFAPWAYDATVWSAEQIDVASLSDESEGIVLRLTESQRTALENATAKGRLVPAREWKVRRHRS